MASSVSQWVNVNHIAIDLDYALELVRDYVDYVQEVTLEEDGEEYTLYEGLDKLCIAENLFCNISNDAEVVVAGRNHYLYLMDCFKFNGEATGVVKVGVSRKPNRRVEQLNDAWKRKKIRFKVRLISKGSWSKLRTYKAENAIHTVLRRKGLQYEPGCKYDGYSELFYDREWIAELI